VYSSTTSVIAAPGDQEHFSESIARRSLKRKRDILGERREPFTVAEVKNRTYGRAGAEVHGLETETNRSRKKSSVVNVLLNTPPNLLKYSLLFSLFSGEKPQARGFLHGNGLEKRVNIEINFSQLRGP
jgi:hypothetical protein